MKCFSASFVSLLFVNSLKNVAPAAANAFLNPNTAYGSQHIDMTPEAKSRSKDVIIQMFEWCVQLKVHAQDIDIDNLNRTWDSVASECTNFIGPSGYGYVQGEQQQSTNTHLPMPDVAQ
jgi:hypothetical protein